MEAQLSQLVQWVNELEHHEAKHRSALPRYVDELEAKMASASAATGSTAASATIPADLHICPFKIKLMTMGAELQLVQLTMETECPAVIEFRENRTKSTSLMTRAQRTPPYPPFRTQAKPQQILIALQIR